MTKKLVKFLEIVGAIATALLFLTILWQVVARVILSVSSTWTVEIGRALFIIMVFCGAPVLILKDKHMAIRAIVEKLKGRKLKVMQLIIDSFMFIAIVLLCYGCFDRMINTWNDIIPTVEWLTSGKIYAVMLFGSLCMLYAQVVKFKSHLIGTGNQEKESE